MAVHQLVFVGLWLVVCLYALARGGSPERLVATGFLLAGPLTRVAHLEIARLYQSVEVRILLIDLALMVLLLFVALRSARYWPMAMMVLHGPGVLGHAVRPLGSHALPASYYSVVAVWGFPMLILLGIATWRHRARLTRYGIDYAWSSQLPKAYLLGEPANEARRLPAERSQKR